MHLRPPYQVSSSSASHRCLLDTISSPLLGEIFQIAPLSRLRLLKTNNFCGWGFGNWVFMFTAGRWWPHAYPQSNLATSRINKPVGTFPAWRFYMNLIRVLYVFFMFDYQVMTSVASRMSGRKFVRFRFLTSENNLALWSMAILKFQAIG